MKVLIEERDSTACAKRPARRRRVDDILRKEGNNFDLVRLIAAFAVIFSHAYPLSPQAQEPDFVFKALGHDTAGSLAVKVFFLISGLLVTHSIARDPSAFAFLAKRVLRIFPALVVCNLVTVFVIGLALTDKAFWAYLSNSETYTYIVRNSLLYDLQWRLPGLFETSRYTTANGSLWTLPWEVTCYLFLLVALVLGVFAHRALAVAAAGLMLAIYLVPSANSGAPAMTDEAYWLLPCFLIGILFALLADRLTLRIEVALALWGLNYFTRSSDWAPVVFYISLFYSILLVFSIPLIVRRFPIRLDVSYGVYLYGFPIQQSLYHLFPQSAVWQNQLGAIAIALALGILSAIYVERPAITWGRSLLRERRRRDEDPHATVGGAAAQQPPLLGGPPPLSLELAGYLFLAAFVYALALKFVFPGYFSPFWPHHSDFFMANDLRATPMDALVYLNWPRPIGTYLYALIGNAPMRATIGILAFVTLLNAALSVVIFRRLLALPNTAVFAASAALYFFVLFTAPGFYVFYSHDGMAQLSFLLLLLAGLRFEALRHHHAGAASLALFVGATCAFLTKETYVLTSLGIAFAFLVLSGWRDWRWRLLPGLTLAAAALVTALLSVRANSIFIGLGGRDAYRVDLSPLSVVGQWWRYATTGVNVALICALAILLIAAWWDRRSATRASPIWLALAAMGAGALAWVPNAALPDNFNVGYSWNGAYLFFLPILRLASFDQRRWGWRIVAGAVAVVLIANPVLNRSAYASGGWVLQQEAMLRNLWISLGKDIDHLPADRPSRILITGLAAPFAPFRFPRSLDQLLGDKSATFAVVAFAPRENKEGARVRYVPLLDSAPDGYDEIWLMRRDGRLVRNVAAGEIAQLALPSGTTLVEALNFPELLDTEGVGANACVKAGVIMQYEVPRPAIEAVDQCVAAQPDNPYGWFWKGKLALSQGDTATAASALRNAVRLDDPNQPNPWFKWLLDQVPAPEAAPR